MDATPGFPIRIFFSGYRGDFATIESGQTGDCISTSGAPARDMPQRSVLVHWTTCEVREFGDLVRAVPPEMGEFGDLARAAFPELRGGISDMRAAVRESLPPLVSLAL